MTEPSAEMIEAAAKALADYDNEPFFSSDTYADEAWDDDREVYRDQVRIALAAALSVGEVVVVPLDALRQLVACAVDYDTRLPHGIIPPVIAAVLPEWAGMTSPWTAVPNEEKTDG